MYKPFDTLPDSARVWIYQSDRELTDSEVADISVLLEKFTENWEAHGAPLAASFLVAYNRFIILAVDQDHHSPTGCSIDKSVDLIRGIEQSLSISLFSRTDIAFQTEGKVFTLPMTAIKQAVADGELEGTSITFDNTVQNLSEFRSRWQVEMENTWLKRYLKQVAS
ncbi:hypothetical protein V6R21_08320 [Limibacter armeniacum]|uniref:hypothetical protein n=1 Tax=Limibacter armeniacum TaxID=466084 RepID=UPI002FE5B3BA